MSFHKRDQFGTLKNPKASYASFKEAKRIGSVPSTFKWQHHNEAYRKRIRSRTISKLSRRRNRR